MTRDVVTVRAGEPLAAAIRLMLGHGVSGLPVLDAQGRLVGMLTQGDLLRRPETGTERPVRWLGELFAPGRSSATFAHDHGRRVCEVMTRQVVGVTEGTSLREVVTLMQERHVSRVTVTRDGALVGLVARGDLVRALGRVLDAPAPPVDDEQIRRTLSARLDQYAWERHGLGVTVRHGCVTVSGKVWDERDRAAVRVTIETQPGVVSLVDDELVVWPRAGAGPALPPR